MNPSDIVGSCRERGADDVICHVTNLRRKQIRFANNEVTASKLWDSITASIFLAKDRRVVATTLNDPTKLDETLDELFSIAGAIGPSEDYHGIADGTFTYKGIPVETDMPDDERIIGDVFSIADDCRAAGVYYTTSVNDEIATSSGIHASDESTSFELSVRMFADKNASGHAVSCARTLHDFDYTTACENAVDIARDARNPVRGEEGRFDVVFSPLCFANLLDDMMFQTSAFYVDSGLSCFKDRIGTQVASELVTVHDDGTRPDGLGSSRYDDEGVPTRSTPVIEDGILTTYLHNTSTAKKYETKTTANAGLIAPRPTNIVLSEGDRSIDELLLEMGNGLYITNTWYTRFQNYSTGDFSTIPRDGIFMVRDGEISSSLKDIRISENMIGLLSRIAALGDRSEHIHWWEAETPTFTPAVLVKDVRITRSTG